MLTVKQQAYERRPDIKARRKAYEQRPEVKARRKAYGQRPEVKARQKEYDRIRYVLHYKCKHTGLRGFQKGGIPWNKGIHYGIREKNPNWKGGISEVLHVVRTHPCYKQWRQQIFIRDYWTCKKCGQKGLRIHAHHIISFQKLTEDFNIKSVIDALNCVQLWDINNGITLCTKCHKEEHNLKGNITKVGMEVEQNGRRKQI
jgi:hypothetical protein